MLTRVNYWLDGGYATQLYCRSLQLICMHYGISSDRNAQYVETTLDTHVHLQGRVVGRSDTEYVHVYPNVYVFVNTVTWYD